jgi:dynactin 1
MSGFDPQRQRSLLASSSRNSSPSSTNTNHDISSELKAGVRAQVQGKIGTIRFVGITSFQTGKWVGIELDDPHGKNSGVVQGKRYFECKTNHGVFVRPSQVKVLGDEEENHEIQPPSPSLSEQRRFAPAQDPNLAAAQTIQQHTPSSSSTLLPSRITSPSRISRLPNANRRKPTGLITTTNQKSASPTASITATPRKSNITSPVTTRPRSNTTTQKDTKENKLLQLKMQQQERLALLQKQQQQLLQQQQEEEDAELQRQLQEEEELALRDQQRQQQQEEEEEDEGEDEELDHQQYQTMYETESTETASDRDVGLVSTTSSTAMPRSFHQQPQQQSYGSLAVNLPISKSDQMIPLKDYEELRLKLKILESKRQEDRERYREHEKVKEEAEQFLTLRNKLQDKIAELQKELRETKRQLKESSTDQEMYESKYNDVIESLEMMTLDKEVAEERAENLQQEVSVLKDKIEEISVDLDILKKEADIINRVPDRDGEEKTPLEVIQLERHNERLKEALLK